MTDTDGRAAWRQILDGFVADLGAGKDRVPLERVLRRHRAAFAAVLATGRTWPQIACALTQAGARHKQGQPMSAKQLRTVFGRTGTAPVPRRALAVPEPDPAVVGVTKRPARGQLAVHRHSSAIQKLPSPPPTADVPGDRVLARLAEARRARAALKYEFDE